jgi:hypothetical protein
MSVLNTIGSSIGSNLGIARQMGRIFVPRKYKIGDIRIDTVIRESHASTAAATRYPTELGASMADHIVINPKTLTVNAIVSDIVPSEAIDYGLTGLVGDLAALSGKNTTSRSKTAWARLKNLQSQRELLTIETNLCIYENMALVSLSNVQDKDSSNALFFTATFEEILTIELVAGGTAIFLVDDPITETSKNNQGTSDNMSSKKIQGKLKPSEVGDSFAFSGAEAIGGLFN